MTTYQSDLLVVVQLFLQQLVVFVGKLLLAIIVFIIGYLIAVAIGKIVTEILKSIRFNRLFEKEGWRHALQRAGVTVNPAEFIGAIFKWVFAIAFLSVSISILEWNAFSVLITQILGYLPNLIVAVLVFVVAVIISDYVEKIIRATVERMKVGYGFVAASIVKWTIWIFAFFMILDQLLPQSLLVKTLYTAIVYGIVSALALGIGLAIGLGGKSTAEKIISDMHRKIEER